MEARPTSILDFISKSQNAQFVIPVYQRMYSWEEEHCKKLWDDILSIGSEENKAQAHFIGSVMYIADNYSQTGINKLSVIDGQQRLTTLTLLLIALSDILEDEEEILEKFSKKKIRNRYLTNPDEERENKYKLLLSQTDKDTLIALIDKDKPQPQEESLRIKENLKFFKQKIEESRDNIETICRGINKLSIIDISLDRDKDDAQLIFESMNSTGKDLSQADLIRNYILMGLEIEEQTKFYEKYWRVMELEFGQRFYGEKFDFFVRHYLTLKNKGKTPNIGRIYEAFKEYHQRQNPNVEAILLDLQKYANYYCAMSFKKEKDKELLNALKDLNKLEVEVVYPFCLELYDDYKNNLLSKNNFIEIIKMIESYIFRRAVCGFATNGLNKTFASLSKDIQEEKYKEKYLENTSIYFCLKDFPSDNEFIDKLSNRDIYKSFKKKEYLLYKLENHNKKEKIDKNNFTIEHIMPQNIEKSEEWQRELGENWQEIHEKYLHTLGNLTLTKYNPELSNKSFSQKQDIAFKISPLELNESLKNIESWNGEAMQKRAKELAIKAVKVWQYPKITKEILKSHKAKSLAKRDSYTFDDHKFLKESKNKVLFDTLSTEILALDENISEEVLKQYIAYKLDTNFVDIIPQKNRLKLSINIYKDELDDPLNLAKDVEGRGWANGKVEVILDSMDNLPYCMGLIRQALEKQQ